LNRDWVRDVGLKIADSARIRSNHIFIDISGIASVPLAPNKSEMRSILLVSEKGAIRTPISQLPIINSISGHLDMLRVYTSPRYRTGVSQAARKIFGEEDHELK
jgi:hypothetical protein